MTTELYRSPTRATQDVLGAGPLDTVFPPARFPFAQILYLRDVRRFYMRVGFPTAGTAAWELIGGPGASLGWPKYVVNVAGQQPSAPYSSIQSAIDAAVADGHDQANPTTVLVFPGTYVGDVTMRAGITVQGFASSVPSGVNIVGTVTCPGNEVAEATYHMAYIGVVPPAGMPAFHFTGTLSGELIVWGFFVQSDGAPAVLIDNTGFARFTALDGVFFALNLPVGAAAIDVPATAPGISLTGLRAYVVAGGGGDIAIANRGGGGSEWRSATIVGQVWIEGGSVSLHSISQLCFGVPALLGGGGSFLEAFSCVISHNSGGGDTIAANPGGTFWQSNSCVFTSSRILGVGVGLGETFLEYARLSALVVGSGAILEAEDGEPVDTVGVATVRTLPRLGGVPPHHEIWFKWARDTGGGGSLAIAPFAGENIDDAAVPYVVPVLGNFVRFSADATNNTWWRIG